MHSTRNLRLIAAGSLLLFGGDVGSPPGTASEVQVITPAEIKWTAVAGYPPGYARATLEGKGNETGPMTYRVRLPAGFRFEPHTHAHDEHVTVLEGEWGLGVGDTFNAARVRWLPVGSFVIVPAGTPHFVATDVETIIQVHGTGPAGFQRVGQKGGHR